MHKYTPILILLVGCFIQIKASESTPATLISLTKATYDLIDFAKNSKEEWTTFPQGQACSDAFKELLLFITKSNAIDITSRGETPYFYIPTGIQIPQNECILTKTSIDSESLYENHTKTISQLRTQLETILTSSASRTKFFLGCITGTACSLCITAALSIIFFVRECQ